jgi:hypothetical protein
MGNFKGGAKVTVGVDEAKLDKLHQRFGALREIWLVVQQ